MRWHRSPSPARPRPGGPCKALRTEGAGGTRSLCKAILEQDPERHDAIAPGNLLALVVTTAVVSNRHFVDAITALEDLGGDLRLDAEPVALQLKRPQDFHPHRLVAGLHVGQAG